MAPEKNMSKPGGKVTKSVFSGPGRRLSDGKEIVKSNKRKVSEIASIEAHFLTFSKMTEGSDDGDNDSQEGGEVVKGRKRKVSRLQ